MATRHLSIRKRISIGTDFHHHNHEGSCLMLSRDKISGSEELVSLLKSGDYALLVGESVILP